MTLLYRDHFPRAPKAYRRKGRLLANPQYQLTDPDVMSVQSWLKLRYKWLSQHAAVAIDGTNCADSRQLFHNGVRPAMILSLLSYVQLIYSPLAFLACFATK